MNSPFDLSGQSIEELREMFSHAWRRHFPSKVFTFDLIHFIKPDNTHCIMSYEILVTQEGKDFEEAKKAFVAALNGYYSHHLLERGGNPFLPAKNSNGLAIIKKDLVDNGWTFKQGQDFPTTFESFLERNQGFLITLKNWKNTRFKFECEMPIV